jgi:hypothetical protein
MLHHVPETQNYQPHRYKNLKTRVIPIAAFKVYIQFSVNYEFITIHTASKFLHPYKVKFSLEQAMKAQRGSKGIALLFL